MTVPTGFQPESTRKTATIPSDSALSQPEQPGNPTTSSRTDAQTARARDVESVTSRIRRTPQAVALARLIADIRPDWSIEEIHAWALRDERPWSDVVAAGINGARDRNIRQVGGLQFAGPAAPTPAMTYLSAHDALAEAEDGNICIHGGIVGRCPLCRGAV